MHNLYKNRMMYVGEKPWHELGVRLDRPANSCEAITAAGLAYRVELRDIYFNDKNKKMNQFQGKVATVNCENGEGLGIVGENYRIIQNDEAFDFFDSVVGAGEAFYETAGALGKGERIWILARLPGDIVIKDDPIKKYLVLTNSHDGRSALKMYFTPIRVVCQNTLIISMGDARGGISIRHSGDVRAKVGEAQRILGIAKRQYDDFAGIVKALMGWEFDSKCARSYFCDVLDIKDKSDRSTRRENQLGMLHQLWENGRGNNNRQVRHTAWTAYNACTEYADYYRTKHRDPSSRIRSVVFESAAAFKERAYEKVLAYAGINKK
ncbi:MAG: hypothetical protein [Siphoviridae sp. ctCJE6]|nr:MAG: hypothetical protein [Siphoviridae sp. ctCJE6]